MARTSKTKLGGPADTSQSRTMIEAARSGAALEQRAHEQYTQQIGESAGRHAAAMQQAVQIGARAQERKLDRAQQESQFEQKMQEEQLRTDISAKEKGFDIQRPQDPQTERALKLQQDMDAAEQRGAAQAEKPLEIEGGRPTISRSEEWKAAQAGQAKIKQTEVAARMKQADAALLNAKANYAEAIATGDDKAQLEANEAMVKAMAKTQEEISDIVNGKTAPEDVARAFADEKNPDFMAAIESGQVSKARVVQIMRAKLGHQQVAYMAETGMQPPDFDPSNPVTKQFMARFGEVAAAFRGSAPMQTSSAAFGQAFGQSGIDEAPEVGIQNQAWQGLKDYGERNRFLRKVTAQVMMEADRVQSMMGAQAEASGIRQAMTAQQQRIQELETQVQEYQDMFGYGPATPTEGMVGKETRYGRDEFGEPATGPVQVGREEELRSRESAPGTYGRPTGRDLRGAKGSTGSDWYKTNIGIR